MVQLIALSAVLLHAQPLTDEAAVLGFAESLLAEGDAYRAIGEYKRFLYLRPDGPEADAARFAIGLAYLRGGQAETAADEYAKLADRYAWLRAEALLQRGYARYVGGQNAQAERELTRWLAREAPAASEPARERASYLLAWTELTLGRGEAAAKRFAALGDFPGKPSLVEQAKALDHLPERSPWVAGLLSIVPGAGHVYIGQPLVGLAALAWNALFGFALYDAIRHKELGLSLVLGTFESLWYFGTLFGAVSGAQKFNRDARQNALEELRATFDDRPESWPPAPPVARF